MIIFISFILNVSFLFNALSYMTIYDDINKNNYTHDDVNHQNQYRQLSYFHRHRHRHHHHHHQQQQHHPHEQKLEQPEYNRQLASSFDWKFYLAYNNDLLSAGINNELLGTNHYNLYGTLVYDLFYS